MNVSQETLDIVKNAQSVQNEIAKSITQATGLVAYDLQAGAKKLFPVITPLRNMLPRIAGAGGTATNWKSITGINVGNTGAGVSEGNRGAATTTTVINQVAAYKGIGLEDYVTFEADYAATGFDDAKAIATTDLLYSLMIAEELMILGGNSGTLVSLAQTPTPTLSAVAGGGSLSNAAYTVQCVALTLDGLNRSSVSGGVPTSVVKTNTDGSTDTFGGGSAQISATATVTPAANGTIIASVAPVKGAVAYAWYWGLAGAPVLGAITTLATTTITAAATGTQTASSMGSTDNSPNALAFDGIIPQICQSGSGAYYAALANGTTGVGSTLTPDGAGGVVEIGTALQSFWDNYRLSPDTLWVSSQEILNISKKVIAGGGAPLFRFVEDGGGKVVMGGGVIGNYLNPFTQQMLDVKIHPNVPKGTILFTSSRVPYKVSDVGSLLAVKTRRDYYQLEWPLRTRKYEYGVYADELLQNYFPPAFGMITNIANG
jgi:hypothetical protein